MTHIKQILTLFFAFVPLSVFAQESSRGISYEQASQMMRSQNQKIQAHEHEMQALVFDKKAASALRYPQVNLLANFTVMSKDIGIDFNDLKGPVSSEIGNLISAHPTLQPIIEPLANSLLGLSWGGLTLQENQLGILGLELAMPIYMGGKINAANNAARINMEKGENRLQKELGELNVELANRYFGLSLAGCVLAVREEVVEGMELHYNNALSLERNGQIAKGERLYAEMFLERAKAEREKSQSDVNITALALENTLNSPMGYSPSTEMFVLAEIQPLEYYLDYAMENSPLLRDVDLTKSLAGEKLRAERADLLPHLTVIGGANLADYQVTNMLPRAAVGVNLTYKVFNGLGNVNKLRSSRETIKRVEVLEEKAMADIQTLLTKNYNELKSIYAMVESYNKTIEFAQEYLLIKSKAFGQGVATSADVVDAQLNLAKAKIEQLQQAYKWDVALAEFLSVCGLSDSYTDYMSSGEARSISY